MNFYSLTFLLFVSLSEGARLKKEEALKASEHFVQIISEAKCSKPFPRVVKISEILPDSRKTFVPRCTLLHFCGEETGCCPQENQHCVAKTQEPITKFFWVLEMTEKGLKKGVEWLTLMNDTECHCRTVPSILYKDIKEKQISKTSGQRAPWTVIGVTAAFVSLYVVLVVKCSSSFGEKHKFKARQTLFRLERKIHASSDTTELLQV